MLHARKDYQERIQDSAHIIPEDEPVFLIRAQDVTAPRTVRAWVGLAEEAGANEDIIEAARQQAYKMEDWQVTHGSKTPDMP